MLRVEQALEFIELEGTDLDRYRSRFLFNSERDDTMATWLLGAYQNPDGGYPINLVYAEPSNIAETVKILGYASEFGIVSSSVCRRAVGFIRSRQHPDGYWQEAFSQLELEDEMGGEWGRLWLSAYVGCQLCRAGQLESRETRLVRNYLLSLRIQGNRFTSSPAIHFLALSFFALLDGPGCGLVQEVLLYALANFTRYGEPRLIALQASCLLDAGVASEHEILKDAKRRLVSLQAEDGGWGEQYAGLRVRTTIDVLKLLFTLGAWRIVEEG
ncbi:MAG: hypothetical protein E3J71_00275 [Candidatus Stahlbacteria bacterium]|nr:MAG: hypothetical protein E3J71_00275 [Candidatus Stahlbacteria bacterium]